MFALQRCRAARAVCGFQGLLHFECAAYVCLSGTKKLVNLDACTALVPSYMFTQSQEVLTILMDHYPERLGHAFFVSIALLSSGREDANV